MNLNDSSLLVDIKLTKMNNLKYIILSLLMLTAMMTYAQGDQCPSAVNGVAWIMPETPDVSDTVTIFIDLSADPNCQNLVGTSEQLYLWTWGPADPGTNGMWNNSMDEMALQKVEGEDDVYQFKMIPTEFYGVEAAVIYDQGLCFLAKGDDGGSGGDCAAGGGEFKTADLYVPVPSPFIAERKVYGFPDVLSGTDTLLTRPDDVFTLFYNNRVEDKESMQNLDEAWVYFRLTGDDGVDYAVSSLFDVGNTPSLRMTNDGNGLFSLPMIPTEFLSDVLPEGVKPQRLRFQILRWPFINTNDSVDGEYIFNFKCSD